MISRVLDALAGARNRQPSVPYVRVSDQGFEQIVAWVLQRWPGLKEARAVDGDLIVSQILQGWIDQTGQVHGEARALVQGPDVLMVTFNYRERTVLVERRLRYSEIPATLWGPTVA